MGAPGGGGVSGAISRLEIVWYPGGGLWNQTGLGVHPGLANP